MKGIASKIIDQARVEEKAILAENAARMAELKKEAMEEEERLKKAQEAELKDLFHREVTRYISRGRIEAAKEELRARRKIIDQTLADLKSRLLYDNDGTLYREFLMEVMLKGIQTGREEIIVREKDRSLIDDDFLAELKSRSSEKLGKETSLSLSDEVRETGGGFYLKEGKREFNATIDAVIETVAEQFQLDIIRMFFSEE